MPLHRPALTETILSRWEEAGTDRSVATLQMATEAVDAVLGYLAAEVDLPRTAYGPIHGYVKGPVGAPLIVKERVVSVDR